MRCLMVVTTRASKRRLAERFGDTISAKLAFGSIDYVVSAGSDGGQGCVHAARLNMQRKHLRTPP
jgi:hypothetical protein